MSGWSKIKRAIYGTPAPVVTGDEALVLDVLGPHGSDIDWRAFNFADIDRQVRIGRDRVRAACRSLAERALAAYEPALFTEEGELYGAGYRATADGRKMWETLT